MSSHEIGTFSGWRPEKTQASVMTLESNVAKDAEAGTKGHSHVCGGQETKQKGHLCAWAWAHPCIMGHSVTSALCCFMLSHFVSEPQFSHLGDRAVSPRALLTLRGSESMWQALERCSGRGFSG